MLHNGLGDIGRCGAGCDLIFGESALGVIGAIDVDKFILSGEVVAPIDSLRSAFVPLILIHSAAGGGIVDREYDIVAARSYRALRLVEFVGAPGKDKGCNDKDPFIIEFHIDHWCI